MTTSKKTTNCSECGCPLPPTGFCARCALEGFGFVELEEVQEVQEVLAPTEVEIQGKAPLFGRFELLNEGLGGGKGMVYQARELLTERLVGLKVMQSRCLRDQGEVQRFQNEVRALANLDHPHILPIYEAGEHHGQHFYTMKWIAEGSLGHQLDRWQLKEAPVSLKNQRQMEIAHLMSQVARAIQFAHNRGILHRDLKPGNILVDGQGHPYVADFGMAKFTEQEAEQGITMSGIPMGTPAYMSPEQAKGQNRTVTLTSDIWALGVILYELLAGRRPFDAEGDLAILQKINQEEALKPSSVLNQNPQTPSRGERWSLDPNLETICLKCLEKEPHHRYPTAGALAEDLERWLRGEPILARPAGPSERAWKWIKRHPVHARLFGVIAVCIILGTSVALWLWQRYQQQAVVAIQTDEQRVLQQAEKDFAENHTHLAVAQLSDLLRRNPSQHSAAERLLNALAFHSFLVAATPPITGNVLLSSTSPDHRLAALAGAPETTSSTVSIHELASGKLMIEYRGTNIQKAMAFSPESAQLALGSEGWLRILDLQQPESVETIPLPAGRIRQLLYLSENQIVVLASKSATLWQINPAQQLQSWLAPEPLVKAVYSPHLRLLAAADETGGVYLWQVDSGQLLRAFPANPPRVVRHLGFSRDGQRLVCASAGAVNSARVWNVKSGSLIAELPHDKGSYFADFSPDARRLTTASRDNTARIWDIEKQIPVVPDMQHDNSVNVARYSSSGRRIVTASDDHSVRVWDAATGNPASIPAYFGGPVVDAQFTHQDQFLLVWVEGEGIYRLDATPVQRWFRLAQPVGAPPASRLTQADRAMFATSPAAPSLIGDVTPDGSRMVIATGKTAELWNRREHKKVGNSLEHKGEINCARFSPDGRRVVTSTDQRRVRVWDAWSGSPLTDWIPSEAGIPSVWFSEDNSLLITSEDRIWPLFTVPGDVPRWLPDLAESIVGQRFSSPQGLVTLPVDTFAKFKASLSDTPATSRLGQWLWQLSQDDMGEHLNLEVSP